MSTHRPCWDRYVVIAWIVTAACGGSGSSYNPRDFLAELKQAECDYLVRCELVADLGTCESAITFEDTFWSSTLAAFDAGELAFHPDKAHACIDVFASQTCNVGSGPFHQAMCPDVFTGGVTAGGVCNTSFDCAEGFCRSSGPCNPATSCCAATCVVVTESGVGGPCRDNGMHRCARGLYCSGGSPGTCVVQETQEGAACSVDPLACAFPLYCDATTLTCKAPAPSGGACDPNYPGGCMDLRDYCDSMTQRCERRVAIGGDCSIAPPYKFCVGYASCDTRRCVADLTAGATCTSDVQCAGELLCTDGTCALLPALTCN